MKARKASLRRTPQKRRKLVAEQLAGTSNSKTGSSKIADKSKTKRKDSINKKKEKEEEEDRKKEKERLEQLKAEEQNRHPDGPFSVPAGSNITHGMPVPIHCPADIDGPLEIPDDPAVEHSKTDNTTTHASITSGYDVLLGDFEEAFHASRREGWDRVSPVRRRRRFVDLFR